MAKHVAGDISRGDTLLLFGPVGAGKTHFARHLIRNLQTEPEDVPSPTFTLVQTYETRIGTLWHADLYRLGQICEVEELGLADALGSAICLVEWPEMLGALAPPEALSLEFAHGADETRRDLTIRWSDDRWAGRVACWSVTA